MNVLSGDERDLGCAGSSDLRNARGMESRECYAVNI